MTWLSGFPLVIYLVKLARDLTRPIPLNGGLGRDIPLFQGNLGW